MNDKIKITLNIADFPFKLEIDMEQEEIMRKAAQTVNMKLNAYRERYKNQTLEQQLAMVAYHFALEMLAGEKRNDTKPFATKIEELTELLEKHFKGE